MKIIKLSIFFFVLALPSLTFAETKVATVDMIKCIESIIMSSPEGKGLDKKMNSEKDRLLAKKDTLEKLEKELKAKNVSVDSEEAEAFRQKARAYQREVADTEESLNTERVKIQKEALDLVSKKVKELAEKEKVDVVLNRSDEVPTGVLFSNKSLDLTEKVLSALND